MRAWDATLEADALQVSIQRRLGAEGRFKLAVQMSETTRKLMRAGLRARCPELGEAALEARLLARAHSDSVG